MIRVGGLSLQVTLPPRYPLGNLAISVELFQLERFHVYSYQTSISTNHHIRNNWLLWLSSFLYSTPGAYCRARRAPGVLPSQSQVTYQKGSLPVWLLESASGSQYYDRRQRWHAGARTLTYPVMMYPFPLFVTLCDHNPPTLQTDGRTDAMLVV